MYITRKDLYFTIHGNGFRDVLLWASESNIEHKYSILRISNIDGTAEAEFGAVIRFFDDKDAALFKLRWWQC